PHGLLHETLMAQAFIASPVRTPVIGWMSDLESLTVDDARAFYSDWYTPGNALVVVAGDVEADDVFTLAERTYGGVADRPVPVRRPQAEPQQRGARRSEEHTSELQSRENLVCRLLLEKKNKTWS